MYLLIVYDVDVKRVNRVNKFLKLYLHWRQNSVFEGEITISQFKKLKLGLEDIINPKIDSIFIYKVPDKNSFEFINLGIEKNPIELIL
ncbi:MAG: CRISPR-associated endonuclease Cas2 [Methanobacteriaceae archaeon]